MPVSTSCLGTNSKGEPCQAHRMTSSEFCFWHDPCTVLERAQARRRGGQARHNRRIGPTGQVEPVVIVNVDDLLRLLGETITSLLSLENSIARARAMIQAIGAGGKLLELSTLEERLEALEVLVL